MTTAVITVAMVQTVMMTRIMTIAIRRILVQAECAGITVTFVTPHHWRLCPACINESFIRRTTEKLFSSACLATRLTLPTLPLPHLVPGSETAVSTLVAERHWSPPAAVARLAAAAPGPSRRWPLPLPRRAPRGTPPTLPSEVAAAASRRTGFSEVPGGRVPRGTPAGAAGSQGRPQNRQQQTRHARDVVV